MIELPEFMQKLPNWVIELLRVLFLVTVVVILSILMFYKGMIYQCQELGMNMYWTDKGWVGFECKKTINKVTSYPNYGYVPNITLMINQSLHEM